MRTGLKLRPGQRGTKKLLAQCGDRLVCIRYRYDEEKKKRFKTIELIKAKSDGPEVSGTERDKFGKYAMTTCLNWASKSEKYR